MGLDAENVADRKGELGLVQSVEMKLIEAFGAKLAHLLNQYGGGDELAAFQIFFQSIVKRRQPIGDARAATTCHAGNALEIRRRHQARHDRYLYAGFLRALAKA